MMTVAYVIVGVLLGLATILCVGVAVGIWFAVSAARPELLERRPADRG
jgi:hypothetical protein